MMNIKLTLVFLMALSIFACVKQSPESASQQLPMVGNDRDAHGCIGSAGYLWCGKTAQCERPWELAQQRGFANSSEALDAFCNSQ